MGVGAHLDPVFDRIGQMGDEGRGLGVDLAALQAEAAIDAMGAVAKCPVGDRHGTDAHLDAQPFCAPHRLLGATGDRVGRVGVTVGIAPRPVLSGYRQLGLDTLVVGPQFLVGDRPVRADAVAARGGEVRRVKARDIARVMHHRAAHAVSGVVLTELHRILAADHPGAVQ